MRRCVRINILWLIVALAAWTANRVALAEPVPRAAFAPLNGEAPGEDEPPAEDEPAVEPTAPSDDDAPADLPPEEAPQGDEPAGDETPVEGDEPPAEMTEDDTPAEDLPAEEPAEMEDEAPAQQEEQETEPTPRRGHPARLPRAEAPAENPPGSASEIPAAVAKALNALRRIHPGQTTREALHSALGEPAQVEKVAGGARETFQAEPLDRVRVMIVDDLVQSFALRLAEAVDAEALAKSMAIDDVEPVDVLDEQGMLQGQAYPEYGILFAFDPTAKEPRVAQLVVEQPDAQPYLARAEKRLETQYTLCLSDLKKALELAPENSRAHWLHAELTLRAGATDAALSSAQKAVSLESKEPEYRITLAKVHAATADYSQAIEQVRQVIEWGKAPPLVMAQAYWIWGDSLAGSQERDYQGAIQHHMHAIKLAEPLANSNKFAMRRAAQYLLMEAHLSVAHDVGWGRWQQKPKVVAKWLEHAAAYAEHLSPSDRGPSETHLRLNEGALSALAGINDPPDPKQWLDAAKLHGKKLYDAATDDAYRAHLAWHLGLALHDGVEIQASRRQKDDALALGQLAMVYFEKGAAAGKQLPTHDYVRGRLCYRMGAIYAIEHSNHKQAVTWFDRAVPLLESPVPAAVIDCGRQGETFVSIAVSYWENQSHQEALRLTNQGVKLMEQAAGEGLLAKTALAVPYGNLASMHEQLGDFKEAEKYSEMATRYEKSRAK